MVFGNLSTGYWLGAAAAAGLHWQELGRTTLSGTSDTIDVTSLAAKPYIMILQNEIGSGSITGFTSFNNDSGSNYAYRTSENGASDGTSTSQANIRLDRGSVNNFIVGNIMNVAGQEKLVEGLCVGQNTAGAGNVPERWQAVAKWANTSDSITSVKLTNTSGGDFASGSEVVVLGYDPDDTEGGSVWEELKSVSLSSAADSMDSGTFTAKKYLWVQIEYTATGGNVVNSVTFNSDSGSNYARRGSDNGGSDATDTSASKISSGLNSDINSGESAFFNMFIINKSDKEKLVIAELISTEAGTGAGNAPDRAEFVAKWANTSSQITSIQVPDLSSGQYNTGSSIKVWGFD